MWYATRRVWRLMYLDLLSDWLACIVIAITYKPRKETGDEPPALDQRPHGPTPQPRPLSRAVLTSRKEEFDNRIVDVTKTIPIASG